MTLEAGYLEIVPDELVEFLLRETGQIERGVTNPTDLLSYLKLIPVVLDLERALPPQRDKPKGVLSFPDRIVGIQEGLLPQRARFTVLHEIAHYVLPQHRNSLFICSDADMDPWANSELERQASEFAAALLFQGDRFTLEANSLPINAASIKLLKEKYDASFEATGRRFAVKSFRPCMLVVFETKATTKNLDTSQVPVWVVKYAVPSPAFANQYFNSIRGEVPPEIAIAMIQPGRDFANSVCRELRIEGPEGKTYNLEAEFFSNHYNIFALLVPRNV